ncbi:MAG TPA: response regulator transcription factor [Actinomycetota bacterium]|jgi:two-component system KDP operon response regulator KdpE
MTSGRVLIVDDEPEIRQALSRALASRAYETHVAAEGEEALAMAAAIAPDLIVLDLNLPGIDGLEVCRRLRAAGSVPILILSVREEEADKVAALDLGADDYLTKPFGIDELLARVRALLRRAAQPDGAVAPGRFRAGDVVIDVDDQTVRRGDENVHLTRTEWDLLRAMASHPGKLLTHRWLLEHVWGPGYETEVLRMTMSRLRRKIERDPARARIITTDPGVGYRWTLRPSPPDGSTEPETS